jgi:ubiquinone/menaquinone biosynthesis C-methylase UbiE
MSENIFESKSSQFDQWYDKYKPAYESEIEAVKLALQPFNGNNTKGIEIAVGSGRFASRLAIQFGVDISLSALKLAAQRGISVVAADAHNLPFPSHSFNCAIIITSLSFFRNPALAIQETSRILCHKGKIAIAIIDRESFLGKLYKARKSKFYENAKFLSATEVRNLLKTAKFHSFNFFQTIFQPPEEMKSFQPPQSGHGRGGFAVMSATKK